MIEDWRYIHVRLNGWIDELWMDTGWYINDFMDGWMMDWWEWMDGLMRMDALMDQSMCNNCRRVTDW